MLETSLWNPRCQTYVFKPKLHKNSKNGFKTINYRCYPLMILLKKSWKEIECFVDFWILMAGHSKSVDISKYYKLSKLGTIWNVRNYIQSGNWFGKNTRLRVFRRYFGKIPFNKVLLSQINWDTASKKLTFSQLFATAWPDRTVCRVSFVNWSKSQLLQ